MVFFVGNLERLKITEFVYLVLQFDQIQFQKFFFLFYIFNDLPNLLLILLDTFYQWFIEGWHLLLIPLSPIDYEAHFRILA